MNPLLIRRRGMMKAQQGDPYVQWLRSIGCICWLPLSYDGDLTDKISGLSLVPYSSSTFYWDANRSIYVVHTGSTLDSYAASLANGMNGSTFPNNCFSTFTTFLKIDTTGYYPSGQLAPISSNENNKISMSPVYTTLSTNVSGWPMSEIKIGKYEGPDERLFYYNGSLFNSTSIPATQYLPQNWVTSGDGLRIGIVRLKTSYYTGKYYGIKNIYVFDRKLTAEQVALIIQ